MQAALATVALVVHWFSSEEQGRVLLNLSPHPGSW